MRASTPIEPGHLDKRVTIEYRDAQPSGDMPVDTWEDARPVALWMASSPVRASERFATGQLSARQEVRWVAHYRADLDPDMIDVPKLRRLKYQGKTYDIVAASVIGRNEGIELITLRKVG